MRRSRRRSHHDRPSISASSFLRPLGVQTGRSSAIAARACSSSPSAGSRSGAARIADGSQKQILGEDLDAELGQPLPHALTVEEPGGDQPPEDPLRPGIAALLHLLVQQAELGIGHQQPHHVPEEPAVF